MPAEVETMTYVRQVPWHGLGVKVEGLQTSGQALEAAGLDWEVHKQPVFTAGADARSRIRIPGVSAIVRSSDQAPLGVTGDVFTEVQNRAAFAFGDQIVADEGAHWETAGSLRGGRIVFMSMEMPKHIRVDGDSEIVPYLLISNGHDGKRALEAAVTPIRVVCKNTLNLALANATRKVTLRHATRIEDRMAQAATALGITYLYMEQLQEAGERLIGLKLTNKQVEQIMRKVWPVPESFDNPKRLDQSDFAQALALWKRSPDIANFRNTGWGVVNAVAEYVDHETDYRARRWSPQDTRFRALVIGGVAMAKKNRALALVNAAASN